MVGVISSILFQIPRPEIGRLLIHKKYTSVKIIALTNTDIIHQVKRMMKQGYMGYLLKDIDPPTLIAAVRQPYNGEQVIMTSYFYDLY